MSKIKIDDEEFVVCEHVKNKIINILNRYARKRFDLGCIVLIEQEKCEKCKKMKEKINE